MPIRQIGVMNHLYISPAEDIQTGTKRLLL